jgi:aspartate ammonia-lyase
MKYREENDLLGTEKIPSEAYWGIHTFRALSNFKVSGYKIHPEFIKAYGLVKKACALTIKEMNIWSDEKSCAIIQACDEVISGKFDEEIVIDAVQGGAGTSLNMNINEVIANRALKIAGKSKGEYSYIDALDDINKFQSTNDTYPTALKIACIFMTRRLEKEITLLQESLQRKETEYADIVKIARTQLTDAVLITLGKEFSAFAEAIARDRWRIYKCEERLRTVNLGGTAVGTGLAAPKKYIFKVIENLREITGIGLARAENLVENTQNTDVFCEVSGFLKTHASNLIKISNDIRLLSSGPHAGFGEINLPAVQAGSSIMPGKVNPVIPELVAQVGLKVLGNDSIISNACSLGQLELNQNMPLIAFSMLETLEILINTNKIFREKCIDGITVNKENISKHLETSTAVLTALVSKLGYKKTSEIAKTLSNNACSVKEYVIKEGLITEEEYNLLTSPEAVLSLGSTTQ